MDINELRRMIVEGLANEGIGANPDSTIIAMALIYLGDSIREGTSDVGPAIETLANEIRLGMADMIR